MSRRCVGFLGASLVALSAVVSVAPAHAGGCYGGSFHGRGYPVYDCDEFFPAPAPLILEMSAHEAWLLFQKHPELIKCNPDLARKLEARFGKKGVIVEEGVVNTPGGVAAPAGAGIPPASPPAADSPLPAEGAAPVAGAGVPALPASARRAAGPAVTAAAPVGPAAGAATVADDVDPLNAGPDPNLPPAAPPADAPAAEAPPLRPELEPLLGLWQSVITEPNGEQKVTQVNLEATGQATVTLETALGKVPVKGKFSIDDESKVFTVASEGGPIALGKVISADKDQVVVEKDGVTITYTRP